MNMKQKHRDYAKLYRTEPNSAVVARRGAWLQTYSGRQFWPLDPRAEEIDILDIAHSLSMQCRYAGHCQRFYSVAEHSVYVSQVIEPQFALYGLLHDAAEAYLVDVPRPVKPFLDGYRALEDRLWEEVCYKFGLWPDRVKEEAIKRADNAVLLAEKDDLMPNAPAPWNVPGEPADIRIMCLTPEAARGFFIKRFVELTEGR
jgi:hypothetical protein